MFFRNNFKKNLTFKVSPVVLRSLDVKIGDGLQDFRVSSLKLLEDMVDRPKEDGVERRRRNNFEDGIIFIPIHQRFMFAVHISLQIRPVSFFVS